MTQYNRMPTYNIPLVDRGFTSKDWYFAWQGLYAGLPPSNVIEVTPTGSPFTYTAPVKGFMIVRGGTVSAVEFSRDSTTYYNLTQTAGTFPVNAADLLRITYSVVPTVVFVPT